MNTFGIYQTGVILACFVIQAVSVDLTMVIQAPSSISDGVTNNMDIHCRFEGQARDIPLEYIRLESKKPSGNTKLLAEVIGSNAVIRDTNLRSRATVMGNVNPGATSTSYLVLSISNVSCVEAATYTCSSQYTSGSTTATLNAQKDVNGISLPHELEFIQEPVRNSYPVDTDVKITCTGKVGKPLREWHWFKYDPETKLYQPYTSNIVQGNPVQVTDCAFKRESNLTYRIQDKSEVIFRCTAGHDVDKSLFITINGEVSGAVSVLSSTILFISTLLSSMVALQH